MFGHDPFGARPFSDVEVTPANQGGDPAPLPHLGLLLGASAGSTYNFSGTAASTSTTPDTVAVNVTRSLSGTVTSTSTTSDTVTLNASSTVTFSGSRASTSTTPDTVALNATRSLSGTVTSTSSTPNTVALVRTLNFTGTVTSTSVTTASGGAVINTSTHVSVGVGYTDVSPKQVVRTSGNTVYTLLVNCDSYPGDGTSNRIMAYKANQTGIPTSFSEQDSADRPSGGIAQWGIAIDSSDIIHVIYNTRASSGGNITDTRYVTFDTTTDQWGTSVSLDATVNFSEDSGNQGVESVAIAIDANDKPHVVYLATDGTRRRMKYMNKTSGSWSSATTIDDQSFASNEKIWHPNLAFDVNGRILFTWHIGTFNDTADGRVYIRTRETSGTLNTTVAVSGSNTALTSIDNSGSLLITADNRYHLTFINASTTPANKYIRYYYSDDGGSTWTQNDPGSGTQATHNPGLGLGANGNIRIVMHGPPDVSNFGQNIYYFEGAGGSASWGTVTLWRTDAHVECSINQRWSQYHNNHPEYLDYVYWDDRYPNDAYYGVDELSTGVALNVTRSLSGTVSSTSTTPDTVATTFTRNLSGTVTSTSTTPNTVTLNTSSTVSFSGTATSTSTTPDTVALNATRSLSGTVTSTSTTPDTAALAVTRSLSGSVTSTSTTPDTVAVSMTRNLSGTVSSTSTTPDTVAANVTRSLSGTVSSTSTTSDTVTLNTTSTVTFNGTATSTSTTPNTVALNATRPLSGSTASTSTTPDTVALAVTRSLSGTVTSTSTTPNTVTLSATSTREFSGTATSTSTTGNAALNVTRVFSGAGASASTTPDTVALNVAHVLTGLLTSTSVTSSIILLRGDETAAVGLVSVTFDSRQPSMTFTAGQPDIEFTASQPLVAFTGQG